MIRRRLPVVAGLAGVLLSLALSPRPAGAAACSVTLSEPANNTTQVSSPLLRWSSSCSSYRVLFSPSGTFGADLFRTSWLSPRQYQMVEALWNAKQAGDWSIQVYWRVEGRSLDGTLTQSLVRRVLMDPDVDDDGVSVGMGDCEDAIAAVHPGATETCNTLDDDCDGGVDVDAADAPTWYWDSDGDGSGVASPTVQACFVAPPGYAGAPGDCDDTDAGRHPGAAEVCDDVDQDCDGVVDDGVAPVNFYFPDGDGDGFGDHGASPVIKCEGEHGGYTTDFTDCDDTDALVSPATAEVCDGADQDCDGVPDDGLDRAMWFLDDDGDAFGDPDRHLAIETCEAALAGYTANDDDCDDQDGAVNPAAAEACDDLDNNCDGSLDEGFALLDSYRDADGDGYGDPYNVWQRCFVPVGNVLDDTDCDDTTDQAHPGLDEVCSDGLDNDCDEAAGNCRYSGGHPLDGADGYIVGNAASQELGTTLCGPGDLNGDGYDDLVLGLPAYSGVYTNGGAIMVFHGPLDGIVDPHSAAAVLTGEAAGDSAGLAVAAGDADGDGQVDLFVGAPGADAGGPEAGAVYVAVGPFSGTRTLGVSYATWSGTDSGDKLGNAVAFAGDPDWDGFGDFIVSAPNDELGIFQGGTVYLLGGESSGSRTVASGFVARITGSGTGDNLGWSVAGSGDVNGDGVEDILVGSPKSDANGVDAGAAYVFFGPVSGELTSDDADRTLLGETAGDAAGRSVAFIGDFDMDNIDDFAVGTPSLDHVGTDRGAVYVLVGSFNDEGVSYLEDDAWLRATGGADDTKVGGAVGSQGDMDGDGSPELFLGAGDAVYNGTATGVGYGLYPRYLDGNFSLSLAAISDYSMLLSGENEGDKAGYSMAGGDFNGDGHADVAVGAPGRDDAGSESGAVYVIYGTGL